MAAPNPNCLLEEFRAFERSLALRTAIEMDLFTRIGAGADTIPALAVVLGAPERGLSALCDYLTVQGHLAKKGKRYGLALHSRLYLTKSSPAYLGSAVGFLASDASVMAFCGLRDAVKRGAASSVKFDWVEYARSMAPLARPFAELAAVALKVESAGPMRVLDIGAGHGWYGIAIATRNPLARIFGLDSRKVLKIAMENARQAGIAKRYHPIAGDAFKAEFGGAYDLVLAANFTHHFDSAANIQLFEKSRLALKSGGRMVLIDFIPNLDRVSPSPDASFALTLFATSARGAIYTFREYSDLLHAAGFGRVRRIRSMIITASR